MLSIVIPAHNESGNIIPLIDEIAEVLAAEAPDTRFEVIVVDDGSTDEMAAEILSANRPEVRLLRHATPGGQSAAIHSGVSAARYPIICTLDGDGQNPPAHIPQLVAAFADSEASDLGLVAGQRVGRKDTLSRRLASQFANGIRGWALNDRTRDSGCGLKAFRREAFLALPYFDHMHRYLPALFAGHGWRVHHVEVTHRPRGAGRSHYSNLQRGLVGVVDIFGVMWLLRRRKRVTAPQEILSEVAHPSDATRTPLKDA